MVRPWIKPEQRTEAFERMGRSFPIALASLKQALEEESPARAEATLREKQYLRVTLEGDRVHWISEILYTPDDDPLLLMMAEDLRSGGVYRLVVPRNRVVSMEELPENQLLPDEPRPKIGFRGVSS